MRSRTSSETLLGSVIEWGAGSEGVRHPVRLRGTWGVVSLRLILGGRERDQALPRQTSASRGVSANCRRALNVDPSYVALKEMTRTNLNLTLVGVLAALVVIGCGEEDPGDPTPPCDFTVCTTPAPTCDGDSVVTQQWSGSCAVGLCVYTSNTEVCPGGCSDGACVDPCEGVTCEAGTAAFCEDEETMVETTLSGACDLGECVTTEEVTDCGRNGRICEDNGERVRCVFPPPEPTCDDGETNGEETDEDCGGPDCDPCDNGLVCADAGDCSSGICTDELCVAPGCDDGLLNGEESAIDCGGGCAPCAVGQACNRSTDCESSVCGADGCIAATCEDGVLNGAETDRDCGGDLCVACGAGLECVVDADCLTDYCDARGTCGIPTCLDGVNNGEETDVDCGGPCDQCVSGRDCARNDDCVSDLCFEGICTDPQCTNGTQSEAETGVDCGGPSCEPCEPGLGCVVGPDCVSGVCDAGFCTEPSCTDGAQATTESDVDCGGDDCPRCADGLRCFDDFSCESRLCDGFGFCLAPTCSDGRLNGDESDADCGGAECDGCTVGDDCRSGDDCASGTCNPVTFRCQPAPTCSDVVRNGSETDVDCGGPACDPCPQFRLCIEHTDCITLNCTEGRCGDYARCDDGVVNGGESGIDCGGPRCDPCPVGDPCSGSIDCETRVCLGGECIEGDCFNGVIDGSETDVDCGGGCVACGVFSMCAVDRDCLSGVPCLEGICQPRTCTDGIHADSEVDVDCGGTCPACEIGAFCRNDVHCASGSCDLVTSTCVEYVCANGVMDGGETDVDCGGTDCEPCPDGAMCRTGEHCLSGRCPGGICFSECVNEEQDGDETDVDCGGSCAPCDNGAACIADSDCVSNSCVGGGWLDIHSPPEFGVCRAPTCDDNSMNGDEEAIDCGGSCGGVDCPVECAADVDVLNLDEFADEEGTIINLHVEVLGDADRFRSGDDDCAEVTIARAERVLRFTAPETGTWVFSTAGRHTNFDTTVYAYFETCAVGAAELGCNADPGPAELGIRLEAGDVAFVVVDGAPTLRESEFVLNVRLD